MKELPFEVKLLKVARRRVHRILTKDEIKKLLECATGRIHGMLPVTVHTGFRTVVSTLVCKIAGGGLEFSQA